MRSAAVRRGSSSGFLASDLARRAPTLELRRTRERSSREGGLRERTSVEPTARPAELPKPPVRLRYLLLLGLLVAAGLWVEPRARAAWRVHGLATALADYGVCMAGPTGPGLLRAHRVDEFRTLVRRRLVTASLTDAPFARCAAAAQTLGAAPSAVQAHRARAHEFAEYGASAGAAHSLPELAVTPEVVAREAHAAWPFVRGYAGLVKPSLGAREAPHPVAVPAPAGGRGLPSGRAHYRATRVEKEGIVLAHGQGANLGTYRSTDGGATWRAVPASQAENLAERCPAGADGRAFLVKSEGELTTVVSVSPGAPPVAFPLTNAKETLLSVACDDRALVAGVRTEGSARASLRQCGFGEACSELAGPSFGAGVGLDFPFDLARVGGTTVLALTMGNLVRVTSSRDDGATWTPLAVAFDGGEHALTGARMPTRLLAIGRRLLLHGVSPRPNDGYGLLVSEDHGASFRGR